MLLPDELSKMKSQVNGEVECCHTVYVLLVLTHLTLHSTHNTSGVLEHKWRASLKTILFLLTSNTEATENKVKFLNLAYRVKGFQCHSNNSLQLLELKEKTTTTKQYTLFKSFLCDIL